MKIRNEVQERVIDPEIHLAIHIRNKEKEKAFDDEGNLEPASDELQHTISMYLTFWSVINPCNRDGLDNKISALFQILPIKITTENFIALIKKNKIILCPEKFIHIFRGLSDIEKQIRLVTDLSYDFNLLRRCKH